MSPAKLAAGPVVAAVKVVGLASSSSAAPAPALCFYGTSLPLALGRGAIHTQSWASGDHCAIGDDETIADIHCMVVFEPGSRSYELQVMGASGVRVDGFDYPPGALVRLGSGSCIRVAAAATDVCILFPQVKGVGPPPPPPPLPLLKGAGEAGSPPAPLAQLAMVTLHEAAGHALSTMEIESVLRRAYPSLAEALPLGSPARKAWREEKLVAELRAHPEAIVPRQRPGGAGAVWALTDAAVATVAAAAAGGVAARRGGGGARGGAAQRGGGQGGSQGAAGGGGRRGGGGGVGRARRRAVRGAATPGGAAAGGGAAAAAGGGARADGARRPDAAPVRAAARAHDAAASAPTGAAPGRRQPADGAAPSAAVQILPPQPMAQPGVTLPMNAPQHPAAAMRLPTHMVAPASVPMQSMAVLQPPPPQQPPQPPPGPP